MGKYIENENPRTASFSEHRAAACRTNANAKFKCPLSPIRITGQASGDPGSSRLEPLAVPGAYGFLTKASGLSDASFPTIVTVVISRGWKGKAVSNSLEGIDQDSIGRSSVCGCFTDLVELPGRMDKFCLECSGDVATAILLTTEIDAATLNGGNTDALVFEFAEISSRMLERAQSAQ